MDCLLAELAAIYRETDALHAGSTCPRSTECCRFGITGREPYVTSIELVAIERALARRGGPLSPRRRALPITADAAKERICPLLERDGRCAVYEHRPFGCRTFFCDRATGGEGVPRAVQKALSDRIRSVALLHEHGGDAPRPLSRALGR